MANIVELQRLLLAPAVGTSAVIMSTVLGIQDFAALRYKLKDFKHPYAPWTEEHADPKILRGFKATQNNAEWTAYTVPWIWTLSIFGPAIPVVGQYSEFAVVGLSLIYAYANKQYVGGYISSADDRMGPFKLRTNAFKGLAFGSMIGMGFSFASFVM